MMKVLPWFALLFACTAVPADAHLALTGTPKIDLFSSARLIDTNQSQSLEAVSTADGDFRLPSYKLAGVYFITGNNGQTFDNEAKDNDFTDPTGDNCKRLGFAVTSCASGLFNRACPYNDRIYDKCCEASYTYEASNCPAPRKLSSETCGGKHRCYCDTAQYPFASCNDPQIKGNACTDDGGTRYATCVCPNPVSTPYGCETYYAAPCGSVCKKAYADNCRNRTAVQTPYGCEKYFADCSSKCEKAYSDNCRNRNAVSAPYGCQQVYGDCQSKCEVAYPDNCHKQNAVSIPSNASCSSYYSDCSSKCSAWKCDSGYVKSGNACVTAVRVGSILYGDGTVADSLVTGKMPIGIVFDTGRRLAVALTCVGSNGKEGCVPVLWSSSCYNTSPEYFAINGAKAYEPSGCSKGFCRKGNWFLPDLEKLITLYNAKSSVNVSLEKITFPKVELIAYGYWSSTETSSGVWLKNMSNGNERNSNKCYGDRGYIRPMIYY
ncbi:MAG: hypothetical protein ACLUQJ_03040 [Alphaproteobacteria bacterium]